MRLLILGCLLLGAWVPTSLHAEEGPGQDRPVVDTVEGRAAHSDLRAYYVNPRSGHPHRRAVEALGSRAANLRAWAGRYLLAFFQQTVADTKQGRAPRKGGLPIGGIAADVATTVRVQAAQELGRQTLAGKGTEALAPALWLFREDPYRANAVHGMRALTHIEAPEVLAVIQEVVEQSHESFEILGFAIGEIGSRKLGGQDDALRRFATHYHPEIRLAARQAAQAVGASDLPAYDKMKPFPPRLGKRLASLAEMPLAKRPEGATWCRVSVTYPPPAWQAGGKPAVRAHEGWYLGQRAGKHELLSWQGTVLQLPADQSEVDKVHLADSVRSILDLRGRVIANRDGAVQQRLMERLGRRSFAHTVGRWDPTLAEGLLSAWLVEAGNQALAADVLVPLLVRVRHEGALFDFFRDGIAARLDQQMLRDFVADRHTPAHAVAEHLSHTRFAGWRHQGRARELGAQLLPLLAADSKPVSLPTPAEWKEAAATLDRPARIRQLADWIRLIRAEQASIPGNVSFAQEQFRRGPGKGAPFTRLINPLLELFNMDLQARELPLLLDVVRSPLYMRAFDLPRFQPHWPRRLYRARWAAVALLETVTQRDDLIAHALVESGSKEAVEAHLTKVASWCEGQGNTRLSDRLATAIARGDDWESAKGGMLMLESLNRDALVKAIGTRITSGTKPVGELLPAAAHLGIPEALEPARALLQAGKEPLRGWAALVVVQHGDRDRREGIDALLEVLRKGKDPILLNNAVDPLLATNDEKARGALIDLLRRLAIGRPTMLLVQRLFLLGHPEAKDFLLEILDGQRKDAVYGYRIWSSGNYQPVPNARALVGELTGWAPALQRRLRAQTVGTPEKNLEVTRTWLEEAFRQIKLGSATDVEKLPVHAPYLGWSGAGGWIRRL